MFREGDIVSVQGVVEAGYATSNDEIRVKFDGVWMGSSLSYVKADKLTLVRADIRVGDAVSVLLGQDGVVAAIHSDMAWVNHGDGFGTYLIRDLTRIDEGAS